MLHAINAFDHRVDVCLCALLAYGMRPVHGSTSRPRLRDGLERMLGKGTSFTRSGTKARDSITLQRTLAHIQGFRSSPERI